MALGWHLCVPKATWWPTLAREVARGVTPTLPQVVQPQHSGPAVVLREVHLLLTVRLPDPLRLPYPHPGQLPHQEIQPPQPLPLPGVRHGAARTTECLEGAVPAPSPCVFPPPRFRLVPFLVELRAVMDWVWTDTTLSLSNWMCVEDIYANIFIIKCSRETEKVQPHRAGKGPPVSSLFLGVPPSPPDIVCHLPPPPEIPPAQGAEEEEDCEVWHGGPHHPLPRGHHLVPTALYVAGALRGGRCEPPHRRHRHPQAGGV